VVEISKATVITIESLTLKNFYAVFTKFNKEKTHCVTTVGLITAELIVN
jgi:hypothetical protein